MSDRHCSAEHWELDTLATQFRIKPRNFNEDLDVFIARLLAGLRGQNVLHVVEDTLHQVLFAIQQSQQLAEA